MTTTTTSTSMTNRVVSYFFLFDFYHHKGASEDNNAFVESIIYLYPPKEEIKRQKLLEIGEIITAIQFSKYELFSAIPKEFNFKKSLITTEHYGRHCAFLVLSKDRFTIEETSVHLTHILQLFNTLYGTFNHVQSSYPDIHQMHLYLKQTLTPIVEQVFNENRSIRNLFSAIDYAPLKKNNQLCLLHVKHFLTHLQGRYKIQNGLFAYDKRIMHSTFNADTTYHIQVILALERILAKQESTNSSQIETKLRNGVSIIKIYIPRPPSLERTLNAVNAATTDDRPNDYAPTEPLQINPLKLSTVPEQPSITSSGNNPFSPASYATSIRDELPESSGDITDLDTDPTGDLSPLSRTETDSVKSSIKDRSIDHVSSRNNTITNNSHDSKETSLTDDQKQTYQYVRSRTGTLNRECQDPFIPKSIPQDQSDSLDGVVIEEMTIDPDSDSCASFAPEDMIILPSREPRTNYPPRRRTITNTADLFDGGYMYTTDQLDGSPKFGDVSEKNDEVERDELILYIQRNSRMIFAGVLEQRSLNEEYLQKLWCLILTGIADLERDIQTIPIAGESSRHNSDVKFQFNHSTHQVQYELQPNINNYYHKTPSSESACMAFSALMKMNKNPNEIKTVALSRGKNLVSLNHSLPDRITCFCRRFQEPR